MRGRVCQSCPVCGPGPLLPHQKAPMYESHPGSAWPPGAYTHRGRWARGHGGRDEGHAWDPSRQPDGGAFYQLRDQCWMLAWAPLARGPARALGLPSLGVTPLWGWRLSLLPRPLPHLWQVSARSSREWVSPSGGQPMGLGGRMGSRTSPPALSPGSGAHWECVLLIPVALGSMGSTCCTQVLTQQARRGLARRARGLATAEGPLAVSAILCPVGVTNGP